MSLIVDARGLSCPQPLMMARDALSKNSGPVTVLVDSESSVESVQRSAKKFKRTLEIVRDDQSVSLNFGPAG